ncbi:MAG TPA: hypothetical protein VFT48_19930 [Pyrinomonadaceae bacterium]|nr:hypothetical protein [Pyrinomonadaceae bacterium]
MNKRRVIPAIAITAIVLLQCLSFYIPVKGTPAPFKGNAEGAITDVSAGPEGVSLGGFATGHATHLGLYTREEQLLLNPVTGAFTGEIVFTAADGDQLHCTLTGNFISATDAVGVYTITGGTGRFEEASGEAEFFASLPDGIHYTVEFIGTLDW